MIGVILAGGQSTRMGRDKGLLKQNDVTWSEIAASKLALLQIPVFCSVNQWQLEVYSKIFLAGNLIVDDECIFVKGPLLGLLSIHQKFPDEDVLVLACDMIE